MMNNEKDNLGDGVPVSRKHSAGLGAIILCGIPIVILFTVFLGGTGFIIGMISFLLFAVPIGIGSRSSNSAIKGNCPYCNVFVTSDVSVNGMKLQCHSCKKTFGYYDMKLYKITDENKSYFQTQQEKTNELLKQQLEQKDKSNLEQLKELKELLDMNAITQEEYDNKKKELLK